MYGYYLSAPGDIPWCVETSFVSYEYLLIFVILHVDLMKAGVGRVSPSVCLQSLVQNSRKAGITSALASSTLNNEELVSDCLAAASS